MEQEVFNEICKEIETTYKGINTLCKERGYLWGSFRHELVKNDDNLARYTRARELQLDYLEELLRELTFQESRDEKVKGNVNLGSNAIARDRLKADTLKFILSKLRPQKYGQKLEITHNVEPRVFNIE